MIADELNPLKRSHRLRKISNKPPGTDNTTPTLCEKSSNMLPDIKMVYPIKPQIGINRGTSFD